VSFRDDIVQTRNDSPIALYPQFWLEIARCTASGGDGTFRADTPSVPKTKNAKQTSVTSRDLPAVKKPIRPLSSRPPVAARVDVVVADLERDPRRK